jgi:hypothetical protein
MGHLLDPSTKHEYVTLDFWSAVKDDEGISEFDWCDYVLLRASPAAQRVLMSATVRLRRAADAKMTVFVRASVCVWGLLQRGDAFNFFFLFSLFSI